MSVSYVVQFSRFCLANQVSGRKIISKALHRVGMSARDENKPLQLKETIFNLEQLDIL